MSLVALHLPENIHDWPEWLERQIVGLELRNLVRQLELIGGVPTEDSLLEINLDSIVGDRRDSLLASGITALNETQLVSLIRHPRLLLDLQELVLERGGEYWNNIERSPEHESSVIDERQRLSGSMADALLQSHAPTVIQSTVPKRAEGNDKRSANRDRNRINGNRHSRKSIPDY